MTLLMLVAAVIVVAASMVTSLLNFVSSPDPAVRAGPMYVTLAFTTGAAVLMLVLALNASYLPRIPRRRVPDLQLMMLAMGITGAVVGLLAVGPAANSLILRLLVASVAYVFITVQDSRRAQARAVAAARQPASPASPPPQPARPASPPPQPHTRSRQRKGGRKH